MDEERDQRNKEGINTADQPAEGGPYVEEPTAQRESESQRPDEGRAAAQPMYNQRQTADRPSQTSNSDQEELVSLFDHDAAEKFRARWLSIQSKFVDDPSDSVKQADQLVADVIDGITRSFADRRGSLEQQWNGGEQASTEDLRIALKQYRSFFDRLLTLES